MGKDLFNDRISRFSIRKLNVGVCSVLLGTLVMVGTAATAAADEQSDSNSNSVAAVTTTSEAPATATKSTYEASPAVTAPASSNATASTNDASSTSTAASIASTIATTASIEDTKPENNATEATSISADKSAQLAAGNTESNEVTAITTENSGKSRSRRSVGDPNDPNLIGDDVQDATSTPKVDKPGFTTNINAKDLASQISWLDFGDVANWTGTTTTSSGNLALQVGATYTKEIMPGYVVTIKVKSLKPFQATENYKKRLEDRGATEAEKATYDPNAKNGYIGTTNNPGANKAFKDGEEAKVIAEPQNRWTEITKEGISTGTTKKTTISAEFEGGNIGVQFEISATFRGKVVKPAIVMADGESANPGELVMFTTNGEGWQHIGEWYKNNNKSTKTYIPQDTDNLFGSNPATKIDGMNYYRTNLDILRRSYQVGPDKKAVAWKYFGSADLTTGGLGTGVFGPNISSIAAVPLVMTRGASEVGLYIASSGKQSAMLGFFPLDEGDAPASYGKAIHSIATVDGVTGKEVSQPYLGHLSPDMDENNTLDWFGDDNSATADEGVNQLLPNELKGTTNEMIKMDRTKPGNYTIALEAHTDGAAKANIYGWVDFNQNGIFDEDERSDLATITQDGTVELHFGKSKTYIDPSVTELGVRVRIAKNAAEIESPTGMAFSGEVEDFRTQITHPPKGEFKETTGPQGEKQTATVGFTARGLYKYSRTEKAKIDETVAPYIVDANGHKVTLNAEGYYVVPGQGKYKITPKGTSVDVEFIPEDHFLGTADGISIRRTDTNGYDTGWSTKFPDMEANVDTAINTMDGLYIPTVTPKDIEGESKTSTDVQGATQTGTPTFNVVGTNLDGNKVAITPSALYPAKLVDPATGQPTNALSVTVAGEGTYTIDDTTGKVTFVPEPGFTGTANGVTVTLSAPVGRDKDGTIRDEYIKTATAKYTPTVTPITVTSTDKVSADVQNVPQTQTPTFDLSNDKTAQITSKKLVDPTTGQPTDDTTVTVAGEGSYTIDPTTGAVTFTPEKDFVGTATGVTVQATATITNANGKTATITSDATYTPTVVAAVPTAQPDKSKDIQGATQTGTPTFAGTTVQVNGQDKAITIKDNSYKLLDKDGNEISTTPAYAADGTTEIGTFSIDPATGQVTFTPTDKSYTGAVTPAKVQAESSNGIKVATTYTPEIVSVSPTATSAESTDIQGATQTGKPEFQGGTVNVDGVEKTVAINEAVPATFDDGTKTKTIPNVGTYTVASDGTVTFVPEKSFVGTAPAVTVVREDMNGTKAQATYTPTVTPVKPTADPATSTGKQGQIQTGKPEFTEGNSRVPMNDRVAATFDDGSTTKTVPNVGTYTVASDGTVTFVPEKSFTGEAPVVTVVREDMNGTKAKATYTPTVILVKPTATPAESTGPQGVVQRGTVTFTEGDPVAPIDKNTITLLDENGQPAAAVFAKSPAGVIIGTFTVDKITSVVTFTPSDKSYSGEVVPVKVRAADTNGTTVETTYTPKITPVVPTAEPATSTDIQGATQTGKPTFTEGDSRVPMNDAVPATFDDGSTSKTVDGIGTYTVASDGTVTFVPDPSFTGTAPAVTVVREDKNGTKASATYTPTVNPVTLTPTNKVSEDIQNVPQTETPTFALSDDETTQITSKKLIDPTTGQPTDETTVTVAGEGTYTIDPTTGAVTYTPEKDFVGTAKGVTVQATATITNEVGKTLTITSDATYTPTVVAAVPTATPAISKDIQGATQTGTPTFAGTTVQVNGQDKPVTIKANSYKLLDKDGNEVTGTTPAYAADGTTVIGNFSIDPATGQVTFTPTDKSYTGAVTPVKVQAESSNGIKVDTTYTPEIVPVTPTATPAETTDIQGATQTGKPEFQGGTVNVDGVEKTVAINEAVPATFDDGTKTKTVPNVGTYTVAADGTVTFVPEKSFIGTAPAVTVVREDMNGTKAQATYTPTVTPVKPTGTPVTSTDIQGATQTGKPVFTEGDSRVPMDDTVPATFEDGSTTKTVDGVGTYTVAPDGTVTFKPLPTYVGTPEGVTVKRVDKNGTPATAKYTPTVTPVVPTAEPATSTDKQGQTQTGTPAFTAGNPNVPMDDTVPATFEDGSTTKTVPGEGTYTVAPDGTVTFVPEKSFTGVGTGVTVKRVDKNGTPATAKYTPTVTPVTPTATPATSEAPQGVVQTGTVTFTEGDPVAPIDKDTITLLDENGQPAASVVAKSPEGKEIGTYTVDKTTGVVTFTPTDKSYSGKVVPVKVQAKDTNGTPAETTYTPKITPVVPTAEPATSTDIQGKTQTGKPTFTPGNPAIPMDDDVPATFEDGSTSKTIPGEGTYTVAPDGTVTFVPEKSFTGTGTGVTVKRVDKNGTPATAKYTPTVTPVVPTAEPATSTDIQGKTQTGTPSFTPGNPAIPMDDDVPATFEDGSTTKTIPGEGTYTVAPDGTVTFVPEKSFTGTGTGVTVKRVDKNGTPVTAKYTPTVTPVVSTAEPATSTDIQGATQTGKPKFTEGDSRVPMNDDVPATFDDGSTTKTVDGVGTYTVAVDGTVTFVPEKSFVGTAPAVTVVREDKNGTKASATYTPTVTPVTPTGTPAVSTDVQGATQTGKPNFTEGDTRVPLNDTVPATFDDGTTTKTVPNVGTYTVAPDGTVTFVPEKSFVGTAPAVTVVREDVNGTKAQATYTPTVTPVTPTADPVASTDIQGQTQTGKPNFTPGNPSVPMDDDVPATFEDGSTTKTIPGEGTYTVAPDGTVTFVPEKSFTGKGTGVTVKRVDKNGTPVTATYTPTVTPVAPTAEPVTSIGNKGQTQTGKPVFTEGDSRVPMNDKVPATFDDGSTTKTIPGVGTYTVAPDGTVTFTPEPEFTGTAPAVTVVREDVNGTKAQATYTPTVRPITKFVDKEGKEIPGYPTVDGEEPKAKIPGYRFVETKKLPNGDFEHVYEKVTTSHVDENGKPIPGYPTEDGEQPKKDIPGYDFVKTVVDKDGNIQHIYKKTVTPSPMPTPTPQPQPKPEEPTVPVVPEAKEEVTYIDPQDPSAQLPNTGTKESSTAGLAIFSALAGLSLFGLAKRKKED